MFAHPAIDINADVGEECGFDAALMPSITSANVCAGFHAGSPRVLLETIELAKAHHVHVGAHPGFRDREHFGRRELTLATAEVEQLVAEQVAIVANMAARVGIPIWHVKPHGALYNMAARDRGVAEAVARAVAAFDRSLRLFAPPHSQLAAAGRAAGVHVMSEVFADRAYAADGSLIPRTREGAVIQDADQVIARATQMVRDRSVVAIDGTVVPLDVDTICVHGDTPGCDVLAARLRSALASMGGP